VTKTCVIMRRGMYHDEEDRPVAVSPSHAAAARVIKQFKQKTGDHYDVVEVPIEVGCEYCAPNSLCLEHRP
jgi:hypothetical protein